MIGAAFIGSQRAASRLLLSTTDITSTGSQNYTVPAGTVYVDVDMYGGGGGGSGGFYQAASKGQPASFRGGWGGGGGARTKHRYSGSMTSGDLLNFSVGTGGAGQTSSDGVSGGNTSLNTHTRSGNTLTTFSPAPTAGGGLGGTGWLTAANPDGVGGSASNGNISTQNGGNGSAGGNASTEQNGGNGGNPGSGGNYSGSQTRGNGGVASSSTAATAGAQPGGGGGGGFAKSTSQPTGQAGGAGQVRITAYG